MINANKKLITIIFTLVAAASFAGCDMLLDEEPSCENKVLRFYDAGCSLSVDGERMSEWEAVDYCEYGLEQTKELGCEKYLYRFLKCSEDIDDENCSGCDYHFEDMGMCITESSAEEEAYE